MLYKLDTSSGGIRILRLGVGGTRFPIGETFARLTQRSTMRSKSTPGASASARVVTSS